VEQEAGQLSVPQQTSAFALDSVKSDEEDEDSEQEQESKESKGEQQLKAP